MERHVSKRQRTQRTAFSSLRGWVSKRAGNQICFIIEMMHMRLSNKSTTADHIVLFLSCMQVASYSKYMCSICSTTPELETSLSLLSLLSLDKVLYHVASPGLSQVVSSPSLSIILCVGVFLYLAVVQLLTRSHYNRTRRKALSTSFAYILAYFNEYILLNVLDAAILAAGNRNDIPSTMVILLPVSIIVIVLSIVLAFFLERYCLESISITGKGMLRCKAGGLVGVTKTLVKISLPFACLAKESSQCNLLVQMIVFLLQLVYFSLIYGEERSLTVFRKKSLRLTMSISMSTALVLTIGKFLQSKGVFTYD